MNPVAFTQTLAHNMMVIDDFANKIKETQKMVIDFDGNKIADKTDAQKKVQSGYLCLGIQGGKLKVVDYGSNIFSALIESIKHLFTGTSVDTKVVGKVFVETQQARMQIRETNKQEEQAKFDATIKGKIYNIGIAIKNFGIDFRNAMEVASM